MNQPDANPFVAEILQRSCHTLAGYAASVLLEHNPETARRYGTDAFGNWKIHLAQRILELAAALRVGEPGIVVARVLWAEKAFQARDHGTDDLVASLKALHTVLGEQLPDQGRASAIDYLERGLAALSGAATRAPEPGLDPARAPDRLALNYLQKILSGDVTGAIKKVLDAVDGGLPVTAAYLEVLIAAEREIGRLWHTAQIRVAEEHLVSFAIQRTMAILLHRSPTAAANGKTAVIAAVEKNAHDIGLRAAADLYQLAGWRSIFLGADVPQDDLIAMLDVFAADVLLLGVTLAPQLPKAGEIIRLIREHCGQKVKVVVGGAAFDEAPDLWKAFGADGYAQNLATAEQLGARLVGLRS